MGFRRKFYPKLDRTAKMEWRPSCPCLLAYGLLASKVISSSRCDDPRVSSTFPALSQSQRSIAFGSRPDKDHAQRGVGPRWIHVHAKYTWKPFKPNLYASPVRCQL